jgi:BarA-like signal transduction histidine kinase
MLALCEVGSFRITAHTESWRSPICSRYRPRFSALNRQDLQEMLVGMWVTNDDPPTLAELARYSRKPKPHTHTHTHTQ